MTEPHGSERRSHHLPFKCPTCGHKNRNPRVSDTEGGTPIALCDECGQQVSANLISSEIDKIERARRKAINEHLGWGTDVY